jgi:hypothetical protein
MDIKRSAIPVREYEKYKIYFSPNQPFGDRNIYAFTCGTLYLGVLHLFATGGWNFSLNPCGERHLFPIAPEEILGKLLSPEDDE